MERMLINASQRDEKRVALVSENVLFDFITERPGFEQKIGNIYLGRITSIEPSLDAVFIEFGSERHGFLPVKEISRQYFNPKAEQQQGRPGIRDLLRIGQELMIQVEKEERGNKGAALTTYISLAGSYLVLMPNSPRAGGISRRIEGDERDQLREVLNQVSIPDGMGLIARTAAIGRTNDELKWDLDVLMAHWKNIEEAAKSRHAPSLIHQEGNVVIRAIRDYVRQDTTEIIIDDESEYQNAKHYLEQIRPDIADRVKLYTDPTPLFSRYGIEHQIETAYKRAIDLPSGASIVIDYTEALVSIDINSARATKGSNIEATAFNTNIEAAEEIARQLRLRDIGGLIVIDFIDMLEPSNQIEVEKHLQKCLKNDRARIQIQRISRFGLLEMSRQRLRPSLRDSHQHICPTCSGHGSIRSVDSVAMTLARIIEEEALKPHTSEIIIQASTEASTYLLNEKRHLLAAIEKNHEVKVSVIPNPNLQSSNYIKKRIRVTDTEESGVSSSDRLQEPQIEINLPTQAERPVAHKPAVKQMIPTRPGKASGGGLIKRLINSMFGQQEEGDEQSSASQRTTPTSYTPKPSYTPRQPAQKQRGRRPSRHEDSQEPIESRESREPRDSRESRESRDSRDKSGSSRRYDSSRPSDRSTQRSSDSRQRSGGARQQRGGARGSSSTKSGSSAKSAQYSDSYQDQYKEYTQSTAPSSPSEPTTRSFSVSDEQPTKTAQLDKLTDEAPLTIKAITSPGRTTTPASQAATTTESEKSSSTSGSSTPSSAKASFSSTSAQSTSTTSTDTKKSDPTSSSSGGSQASGSGSTSGGSQSSGSGSTSGGISTSGYGSASGGSRSSGSSSGGSQASGSGSTSGGSSSSDSTSGGSQASGSSSTSGGSSSSGSTTGGSQASGSSSTSGGTSSSGSTSGGSQSSGSGSASGGISSSGSNSTSGGSQVSNSSSALGGARSSGSVTPSTGGMGSRTIATSTTSTTYAPRSAGIPTQRSSTTYAPSSASTTAVKPSVSSSPTSPPLGTSSQPATSSWSSESSTTVTSNSQSSSSTNAQEQQKPLIVRALNDPEG